MTFDSIELLDLIVVHFEPSSPVWREFRQCYWVLPSFFSFDQSYLFLVPEFMAKTVLTQALLHFTCLEHVDLVST